MQNTLSPKPHTNGKVALQPIIAHSQHSNLRDTHVARIIITPGFAKKLLEYNTRNRNLSNPRAKALAKVIASGKWKFNYATIVLSNAYVQCFDGDICRASTAIVNRAGHLPELMDGQHRLEACVLAGLPIETLFVTDQAPAEGVMATIDNTRARNAGDHLSMLGEKSYHNLAASLRSLQWLEDMQLNPSRSIKTHVEAMDNQAVEEALNQHPTIRESVKVSHAFTFTNRSMMAALHYKLTQKDADFATLFFESLADGAGLDKGSPILLLRNRLIANKISTRKLPVSEIAALVIKAWNFERRGKKIRTLVFKSAEDFPSIV